MKIESIDFTGLGDPAVLDILREHQLGLTVGEARKIQFEILKRPPTLTELVLWSIQGSEHCSYKSSRPFLKAFVTDAPNVILGPREDAGIVEAAVDNAGRRYGIALSHESHNHPSQIVPYEGAATGVGGNVRDVCCMGATVVALADGLRFGPPDANKTRWIQSGVVSGIAGYGNPLGIPSLAGDVWFDEGYADNCLVTVLTLGAIAEDELIHSSAPANSAGYALILVGKPTDNSGFGGASFASFELAEAEKEKNKGAVQEPNAFLERHLLKSTYALRDRLRESGQIPRVGFKDLGAGGVACAAVELADSAGLGADVELERIHVGMDNLPPHVALCSETQERFMWVAPDDLVPMILEHYNVTYALPQVSIGARASVIGRIRADGRFRVTWNGETLVDAEARNVTEGLIYNRPWQFAPRRFQEPGSTFHNEDPNAVLTALLAHPNVADLAPIYENYDKQVQGLVQLERGIASAGVLRPFDTPHFPEEIRPTGIAVAVDQNPRYNRIDPYWGGVLAVLGAMRKVAATGATPTAITDCLCYGNPEKPAQMADFVLGVNGVADACRKVHLREHPLSSIPIVAGNVSLYNESANSAIPPSPMIGCIGRIDDARLAVGLGLTGDNHDLYLIGERLNELGGSLLYQHFGFTGASIPRPDFSETERELHTVTRLVEQSLVTAAIPIAEGGLAIAASRMAISGGTGVRLQVHSDLLPLRILFSETPGFLLEAAPENRAGIENALATAGIWWQRIGTSGGNRISLQDSIDLSLEEASSHYREGLRSALR